jgi:two-component system cell cycle sensor histidine kinase/response regulator CckA
MLTVRVVVVDDEPLILGLIAATLREEGHEVHTADNALRALELFKGNEPGFDLLISDVLMPVMGGPELAQRVTKACPRCAILLMSGHCAPKDVPVGTVFLGKPFRTADLHRAVVKALAT